MNLATAKAVMELVEAVQVVVYQHDPQHEGGLVSWNAIENLERSLKRVQKLIDGETS